MIKTTFEELQAQLDSFYEKHLNSDPKEWHDLSIQIESIIQQAGWSLNEYFRYLVDGMLHKIMSNPSTAN